MEILERIIIFCLFGIPGLAIIGMNYYRIFNRKIKSSPAYLLGGLLATVGMFAILGDAWKEKWYLLLLPAALDVGLFLVSFIWAMVVTPRDNDKGEGQ